MHHGLSITPTSQLDLVAYPNANWANNLDNHKSTGGYCIYLGSSLVSWNAKKQSIVCCSSTESEYRSLVNTTAELAWIQSLLIELHVYLPQTLIIWCDNMSASALVANPILHACSKHIKLDFHFLYRYKTTNISANSPNFPWFFLQ